MCRWLAYSGSPVLLEELLYGPKNSLIVQSLHSQMGAEETNGDGFGVGWYGAQETPGVFHSMEPAWNDRNLRELSGHINSGLVFAHIRASTGSPVQHTNCHPFRHGRWLWMHNGLITDFHKTKRDLVLAIDPSLYPEIEGTTDSRRAHFRAGGRPAGRGSPGDRIGRGDRPRPGHRASIPGNDRHHGRRADLGLPLLERAKVSLFVLQHQRAHTS
jgi:glutamine amidotransferase